MLLTVLLLLIGTASPSTPQDAAARRTPVVRVVERLAPAVVNIAAEALVREPDPFFGGFFSRLRRAQSLGSGLIIDPSGLVVTNAHVIEGASRIEVNTRDGRRLGADVLGLDRSSDLALLKVEASGLPAVAFGSSSDLLIGETVVAIGNPFGLTHTVTVGVLSAVGRSVPGEAEGVVYTDFLQTDASINPGNSGGPLVNLAGEVIGVNTAVVQGANGIGFAIPADRARRVVGDLMRFGSLQPVWTGLRLTTLTPELARRSGIGVERGVLIDRVYPGSPGRESGLQAGDVIVRLGERRVEAREDVTTAFYTVPLGEAVHLEVWRDGSRLERSLRPERPPEGLGLRLLERAVGVRLEAVRGGLAVAGVVPGTPAARRGLARGDLLLAVNGQRVTDLEEVSRQVLRSLDRGGLLLVVGRGRYRYHLSFEL